MQILTYVNFDTSYFLYFMYFIFVKLKESIKRTTFDEPCNFFLTHIEWTVK